jgi:hypothetical protein
LKEYGVNVSWLFIKTLPLLYFHENLIQRSRRTYWNCWRC